MAPREPLLQPRVPPDHPRGPALLAGVHEALALPRDRVVERQVDLRQDELGRAAQPVDRSVRQEEPVVRPGPQRPVGQRRPKPGELEVHRRLPPHRPGAGDVGGAVDVEAVGRGLAVVDEGDQVGEPVGVASQPQGQPVRDPLLQRQVEPPGRLRAQVRGAVDHVAERRVVEHQVAVLQRRRLVAPPARQPQRGVLPEADLDRQRRGGCDPVGVVDRHPHPAHDLQPPREQPQVPLGPGLHRPLGDGLHLLQPSRLSPRLHPVLEHPQRLPPRLDPRQRRCLLHRPAVQAEAARDRPGARPPRGEDRRATQILVEPEGVVGGVHLQPGPHLVGELVMPAEASVEPVVPLVAVVDRVVLDGGVGADEDAVPGVVVVEPGQLQAVLRATQAGHQAKARRAPVVQVGGHILRVQVHRRRQPAAGRGPPVEAVRQRGGQAQAPVQRLVGGPLDPARDRAARRWAAGDQVDHASQRVRAVERRHRPFYDLDALQRLHRELGQVDDPAHVPGHRPAVHQHQRAACAGSLEADPGDAAPLIHPLGHDRDPGGPAEQVGDIVGGGAPDRLFVHHADRERRVGQDARLPGGCDDDRLLNGRHGPGPLLLGGLALLLARLLLLVPRLLLRRSRLLVPGQGR